MNQDQFEFYLFSASYKLAQKLYYTGFLRAVFVEERHFNQDLFNFASLRDIPLYIANTIHDLDEMLEQNIAKKNAVGISFGTGLIFKNRHIGLFKHGIWNIHPGKLPQNRGRHPISWSFINNDDYFYVSIHLINEQLDQGSLIHEERIERDINDVQIDIQNKIEYLLANDFLDNAIRNYKKSKLTVLEVGRYNPHLIGKFRDINPENYSAKELYSIFKSQIHYGPVTVQGVNYVSCNFYSKHLKYDHSDIIEARDGIKLILRRDER